MRYEVRSQDDERSVTVEAVDWMMAMSEAIETWQVRVSGWTCSTRANGDVHVQDPTSGLKWVVSPLRTETARRPLRRTGRAAAPAPPRPPSIGKSLGAPPPPAVRSVKPTTLPPAPAHQPSSAMDAPAPRLKPKTPREPVVPVAPAPTPQKKALPVAEIPPESEVLPAPALKTAASAAPVGPARRKPVVREAPAPKLAMPTERPAVPDYGEEEPKEVDPVETYRGPAVPLHTAAPSIAKKAPPQASKAMTLQPENLAERLFELAEDISDSMNAYEACELTLEHCMESVKCEAGSVLRGSLNDQALTFVACAGPAGDALVGRKLRFGRGIVGRSFDLGFTIVVNDVDVDESHLSQVDDETGFRTRNVLCTPIRTEEEHFGVLQLLNVRGGFQGWHVQVAESLAQSLAAALSAGLH